MASVPSNLRQFESLVEIVHQLRAIDGCPWLKQHTHKSLAPYAIEESFELAEAIETTSPHQDENIKEELGDFAFQFVLHSEIAAERRAFALGDVIEEINKKLIRRHPHVFESPEKLSLAQIEENWQKIKAVEKQSKNREDSLLKTPPLPALQKAYRIGLKTEQLAFDWSGPEGAWEKVQEETQEVVDAFARQNREDLEHEIGDLLFSVAHFARHLQLDPEQCLRLANQRFEKRFRTMLEIATSEQHDWHSLTLEEKEIYWQKAKKQLTK